MTKKTVNDIFKVKGYYILVKVDQDVLTNQLKPGEFIKDGNICSASGMVLEKINLDRLAKATSTGTVVQLGDLAYKTSDFTTGAWCKEGDQIYFKRYDGINIDGELFGEKGVLYLLLNDTDVIAVINR